MIKQLAVSGALAAGLLAPNLAQAGNPNEAEGTHLSLLGFDLCIGNVADGTPCDARINRGPPPGEDGMQTMAVSFELMDRRICVGDLPATDGCWLHVPHPDQTDTALAVGERSATSRREG